MKFSTKAIRMGQQPDPATGAIIVPMYQAVNFIFDAIGKPHGFEYSRSGNPTRVALETVPGVAGGGRVSGWRSAQAWRRSTRSLSHPAAGRPRGLAPRHLRRDVPAVRAGLSAREGSALPTWTAPSRRLSSGPSGTDTKTRWIETPANPLLQLVDVRAVAEGRPPDRAALAADNTFSSPYFQRPLTQGADIVMHSTTKYISGHSDVIGGAVVTNDDRLYEAIKFYQNAAGRCTGADGLLARPARAQDAGRPHETARGRTRKHRRIPGRHPEVRKPSIPAFPAIRSTSWPRPRWTASARWSRSAWTGRRAVRRICQGDADLPVRREPGRRRVAASAIRRP